MLKIEDLHVHYGAAQALFGIDLEVKQGETVALVGANGAGKSTLLKAVMGIVRPSRGRILLEGRDATDSPPVKKVKNGLALSPEGRELFGELT
ncbi:MAG: ATP-binding cassette domain-containing protein, partial [Proteobacteria bacterium]|nr:ATP-binding cassette domain-containing protein [Pseudomonadota bacterium]